jgi:hypothetical protein
MQTRHLWIWLLLLLAVALPVGIEARGGKKRVRNKRRQTTVTNSARRLVDAPPPQVLHKEPWLEYRPEFLSVAECQELLRLADNAGSQWNQGAIPGALQSFALSGPPIIGDPALMDIRLATRAEREILSTGRCCRKSVATSNRC